MTEGHFDEHVKVRAFGPTAPAVVWGVLMTVALGGAGATVMRASELGAQGRRVVASSPERGLQRDVARLSAERDELAGRLASLERSVGQMKLAALAASSPETTGALNRPEAPAADAAAPRAVEEPRSALEPPQFGVALAREASPEAARRRWTTLAMRYPQLVGRLTPRTRRAGDGAAFDLVAGPFAARVDAERACAALAERGLACDTTAYAGDPIGRP